MFKRFFFTPLVIILLAYYAYDFLKTLGILDKPIEYGTENCPYTIDNIKGPESIL